MRDKSRSETFFRAMYRRMLEVNPATTADSSLILPARVLALHTEDALWKLLDDLEKRAYNRGYMAASRGSKRGPNNT